MKKLLPLLLCLILAAIAAVTAVVFGVQANVVELTDEVRDGDTVGYTFAVNPDRLEDKRYFRIGLLKYSNGALLSDDGIVFGEVETFGDDYFIGFTREELSGELALTLRGYKCPSGIPYSLDVYDKISVLSLLDKKSGAYAENEPVPLLLVIYDENMKQTRIDESTIKNGNFEELSSGVDLVLLIRIQFNRTLSQ